MVQTVSILRKIRNALGACLRYLTLDMGPSPPTGTGDLQMGVLVSKSGGLQVTHWHCR